MCVRPSKIRRRFTVAPLEPTPQILLWQVEIDGADIVSPDRMPGRFMGYEHSDGKTISSDACGSVVWVCGTHQRAIVIELK
jgi:hypothetical protein